MHVLIVGTTSSGKTTLARQLLIKANNADRNTLVLDPLLDPKWSEYGADFVTDKLDAFLALAKSNKNCSLFIDEAGDYCGQYDKQSWWLATQARHWGHQSIFISQRANMIAVNIRTNCSTLFCFKTTPTNAKMLAEDFCTDKLLEAPTLNQGECIYVPRFGEIKKFNVFQNPA